MKKWIWTSLIVLVAAVVILGAFIPTILSSDAGTNFLIRMVERNTGGQLKIKDLSLSWTGEQRIENLQFTEGKGFEFSCATLSSDCSFWNLIFRKGSVGNTHIENPKISAYPEVSKEKIKSLKKNWEKN